MGNERSQLRFSNVHFLDLLECLWSASQWLIIRMCAPWYWSLSIAEEQSLPPDGQNSEQQYQIRYDLYSTWTVILTSLHLWTSSDHHRIWCTYLFSGVHTYFQAWHIGKNNHLCTKPAWLHPARVIIYAMYLEYLNAWIHFINWEIWMKVKLPLMTEPRSLQ